MRKGLIGAAACAAIAALASAQEADKTLKIGDKAPELAIQEWVKGDPVTGFENGRVYVVEFWATWCGPCIAGMPHVSELQKQYKDQGVKVIGVNIWDDPANVKPFMEDRGEAPSGDELMNYTVAIEQKIEGEEVRNGRMAKEWMAAAGRGGIPSAFIVNQDSRIAWMGHPMSMDAPLDLVVKGEFDIEKFKELQPLANEVQSLFQSGQHEAALKNSEKLLKEWPAMFADQAMYKILALRELGRTDEAMSFASEAVEKHLWNNSMGLNWIAWTIATEHADQDNLDTALKAAKRANELTHGEEPNILDTLARVHAERGDYAKAAEIQAKAVEHASDRQKAEFQKLLEEYKAKASGG